MNFLAATWIFPGEVVEGDASWMGDNFSSEDSLEEIWNLFLLGAGFIVTTITTVGFGDILPHSTVEQLIVMIYQVNAWKT